MSQLPTPVRASFSTSVPGFQTAWDSVSLGAAKKCWRYYQLAIVEGWSSKHESIHLRFGRLYQRALEHYDLRKHEGMDHEAALRWVVDDLVKGCTDWTLIDHVQVDEIHVNGEGPEIRYTAVIGEPVYAVERASWWDPEAEFVDEEKKARNTKTLYTLFRSVIDYLDTYGEDESMATLTLADGKPAVELDCRIDAGFSVDGHEIVYVGHLDRVVKFNNMNYVLDNKTTGTTINGSSAFGYFAQYSPNGQMSGYAWLASILLSVPASGVVIHAAQIAKGFTRFERHISSRTPGQISEFIQGFQQYVHLAHHYAKLGFYPMNENSCSNYGGCTFRDICSKDPAVRPMFLKSKFTKRLWDPLQNRDDI